MNLSIFTVIKKNNLIVNVTLFLKKKTFININ